MAADSDLEGFRPDHYFSRSWALLTRDRGWIKPVLVMSAALLVPIVGPLGVVGYAVEWARLTAWGVTSSPKQRKVQVGKCIASGWRAFVVMLVWGLCWGVIGALLGAIPLVGALLGVVWTLVNVLAAVVIMVAVLRATIYQKIRAGLRVSAVWRMVRHDSGGILRVFGMMLAGCAIIGIVSSIVMSVALMTALPQLIYFVTYIDSFGAVLSESLRVTMAFELLGSVFSALLPALVVLYVVAVPATVVLELLAYTALALWMRQFDVPSWGREEDPMPFEEQEAAERNVSTLPPLGSPASDAASEPAPAPATSGVPGEGDAPTGEPADPGVPGEQPESPAESADSPVSPSAREEGDGQDTTFV